MNSRAKMEQEQGVLFGHPSKWVKSQLPEKIVQESLYLVKIPEVGPFSVEEYSDPKEGLQELHTMLTAIEEGRFIGDAFAIQGELIQTTEVVRTRGYSSGRLGEYTLSDEDKPDNTA